MLCWSSTREARTTRSAVLPPPTPSTNSPSCGRFLFRQVWFVFVLLWQHCVLVVHYFLSHSVFPCINLSNTHTQNAMENPLCTTTTSTTSTVSVLLWTTIAVFGIVYTLLGKDMQRAYVVFPLDLDFVFFLHVVFVCCWAVWFSRPQAFIIRTVGMWHGVLFHILRASLREGWSSSDVCVLLAPRWLLRRFKAFCKCLLVLNETKYMIRIMRGHLQGLLARVENAFRFLFVALSNFDIIISLGSS